MADPVGAVAIAVRRAGGDAAPAAPGVGAALARRWRPVLDGLGYAPAPVPEGFASRRNQGGNGPIELQFALLHSPEGHEWRQTLITGPRVEILCAMGFPARASEAPVFAIETIAFHGALKIGVVDLEPCVPVAEAASAFRWWAELMEKMEEAVPGEARREIQSDEPWPDWALECFTPKVVYCRPVSPAQAESFAPSLARAASAYFRLWCDWIARHRPDAAPSATKASEDRAQAPGLAENPIQTWTHYRAHHAANTPGRPFLSAQFGKDWTEEFLARGMYG